ncbi:MAG: type II toxin-antitoxin system YoeB family toxin [Peptoniphilus harei]|nr:type II toxin-antitoxin system YoeB family toxin [Peptoniphilus harei]
MRGDLLKYWSIRIDDKNRIVYRVEKNTILIAQFGPRYRDK